MKDSEMWFTCSEQKAMLWKLGAARWRQRRWRLTRLEENRDESAGRESKPKIDSHFEQPKKVWVRLTNWTHVLVMLSHTTSRFRPICWINHSSSLFPQLCFPLVLSTCLSDLSPVTDYLLPAANRPKYRYAEYNEYKTLTQHRPGKCVHSSSEQANHIP